MSFLAVNKYFTLKDNIAYTEDNIRVHKVFVLFSETDEEILAYFSKWGKVLKMERQPYTKLLKAATIHFAEARVAANVLEEKHHNLQRRLYVTACHSWEQPDAYKSNDVEEIEASAEIHDDLGATAQPAPPLNVLSLNDDCLEHVAKFLKLKHQVRMARACSRFRGAIELRLRVESKETTLENLNGMTLWEMREFFLMAGHTIQRFIGEIPIFYKNQIVDLIAKYCPNVKGIIIIQTRLEENTLERLIVNMNHITELDLRCCWLMDENLMAIRKLPKLQELGLFGNPLLTGKNLSKLTTVQTLCLHGCNRIDTSNFTDMVKSMKELESLNIQLCHNLSNTAFEEMEKHCSNLHTLQMSYCDAPHGMECIARLPSLKQFELFGGRKSVDESLFASLAKHKSTQLEFLVISPPHCMNLRTASHIAQLSKLKQLVLSNNDDLNDDCLRYFGQLEHLEDIELPGSIQVTNKGLFNLMRQCSKIQMINIQNCVLINDQFIFDVIELLGKRRQGLPTYPENEPVTILARGTQITRLIMKSERCQHASALIEVSHFCHDTCSREELESE